ncbi:PIG-L family deacetylase, partial [bacterium]|nr:PIG-L family deacetylase [bacterium]
RDMTKAYKEKYPNKDIRIFLPFYNKKSNDFYYATQNNKNHSSNIYEIEDTGITAKFQYGVTNSKARLYKFKSPENGVTTYLVDFPELAVMKKPYGGGDFITNYREYCAFSTATVELLKKMNNSGENFNPKILHTKDWHTVFANLINSDTELKSVHELSNANGALLGKIKPLGAALNIFSEEQIQKLLQDKEFKRHLYTLICDNKELLLYDLKTKDLNKDINDSEFTHKVLKNLLNNYSTILDKNSKNKKTRDRLNDAVKNVFPDINWDEHQDFNPTLIAINKGDAWFTTSKTHFNELLTDSRFSSLGLYNILRLNLNKGNGVLNRIDTASFNPQNPNQVAFTYNTYSYKEGKSKNKSLIFDNFSKENIKIGKFNPLLINNPDNAVVAGYLDKKHINKPLIVNISRFDTNQIGSDIILKTVEKLLKTNDDMTFILGLPQFKNIEPKLMKKFIKEVVNSPQNRGRIVLIDSFLPVNGYFAGADFSIIPSRSETCGLVGYQSMRMGALPIATPVGSMNDKLITPEQDYRNAMGFKTPMHFMNCTNPSDILANTVIEAVTIYNNEPEQMERMVKNAMNFDSDWKEGIKDQKILYDKVIKGEKINNLTMNDLRNIEDRISIKMYGINDINKLKKADILVVLPHSDDEIFFLPMLKYIEQGKSVQIVYSSANDKGHYKEGAPSTRNELSRHREQEALESLYALGIRRNPIKFNIPDSELSKGNNPQIVQEYLSQIISRVKPQVVLSFGPDGTTGNPDHKKLGELVFNAVKESNSQNNGNIKLYQMAFTKEDAQELKDIMKDAYTDAFDFVNGVEEDEIIGTDDVSPYMEKIENSLKKHVSQWHKQEVDGLLNYYGTHGAKYTELDTYPQITNPISPWVQRREEFSKKYGSEFSKYADELYFTPQGANFTLTFKIPTSNYGRKHLTISDKKLGLKNYDIEQARPEIILSSIAKIKTIPEFKDIEYIDLLHTNKNKTLEKIVIPIDQAEDFIPKIKDLVTN